MGTFKDQNLLEYYNRLKTDLECKQYLAGQKDNLGCKCTRCNRKEPATANTWFHRVKFGVRKAFFICFEMVPTTKSISASYMAVRHGVTEKTTGLFMMKAWEAMSSSGNHPMYGKVHVDEFVPGGKDPGKIGRSHNGKKGGADVELTKERIVKRMYAMRIRDLSVESPQYLFVNHIGRKAKVRTDKWRGYGPMVKV